jgi:hypothetical protein
VPADSPKCPSAAADFFPRQRIVADHARALFTIFRGSPKPFVPLGYYAVGLERTEGAMQPGCYVVEKYHSRWVVSVDGAKVLICDRKRTALAVVRAAARCVEACEPAPDHSSAINVTPAPAPREAAR